MDIILSNSHIFQISSKRAFIADDNALRKRCLNAARDAFEYMRRNMKGGGYQYVNGKASTMITGGGHEYAAWRQNGGWK
jgi:hypothetical protein